MIAILRARIGLARASPSPGRAAEAGEHLHDADEKIAAGLIARVTENVATVEKFQRPCAFHRAAVGHAVKAAFVVSAKAPRAFGDVEDDAFAGSQVLIAQVGCAAHLAEGNERAVEFHRDAVDIKAFALEVRLRDRGVHREAPSIQNIISR